MGGIKGEGGLERGSVVLAIDGDYVGRAG